MLPILKKSRKYILFSEKNTCHLLINVKNMPKNINNY